MVLVVSAFAGGVLLPYLYRHAVYTEQLKSARSCCLPGVIFFIVTSRTSGLSFRLCQDVYLIKR